MSRTSKGVPDKITISPADKRKGWILLFVASIFEILFALCTNASQGFTVLWASIGAVVFTAIGIFLLSASLRYLDVGVGYTVWVGIGAIGTVVFGAILFDESVGLLKAGCFVLIIGGIMALQLADRRTLKESDDTQEQSA